MDEMNEKNEAVLDEEALDIPGEDAADEEETEAVADGDENDQASKLEDALSEANDKYLRLFADYDNYRKRTSKEKTEIYQNASADCIEKLLPVIDSFERSLDSECTDENFKNGMQMIFNQMKEFLTKMNVTEIDALGAEFDPNIHNAISQQDGTDYAADHVCAVYQKGYMLGDKLIRPAMVAVAV